MPRPGHSLFGKDDPQLGLFDRPADEPESATDHAQARLADLRERLPGRLRFGTSSWTFPGWAGLVYHRRYKNQRTFVRESLGEYAQHPLMRTVGIDRGYYTPVPVDDLRDYAGQLPEDFRAAIKVWQRITMPAYPRHPKHGDRAGRDNPDFLGVKLFVEEVHAPVRAAFSDHMGPWILEIAPTPHPIDPTWFCQRLGSFLREVPRDFPFAVELRDKRLLTPAYVQTLRDGGATHVFNYWSRMPNLREQMTMSGLLQGPLLTIRLLLPPGTRYDDLKEAYAPFDRLVAPQPAMRADVQALVQAALERDMDAYVLVNNKAEGSSPLTVLELAEMLAG